jgi:hypothetical protein
MNTEQKSLDQILFAQAIQIALTLGGKPFNAAFATDVQVEAHLNSHKELAKQVYRVLKAQ